MAISVSTANNQATQIQNQVDELRKARKQLLAYKSSINTAWEAAEVPYINTAIDQVVGQIDAAINGMNSLGNDIRTVAATIKREDDAAAAAARARAARVARQQRIDAARYDLQNAEKELDKLILERNNLQKAIQKKMSLSNMKKMTELLKKIESAEQKCNDCKRTLNSL